MFQKFNCQNQQRVANLTYSICAPVPMGKFDLSLPILLMLAALQRTKRNYEM